MNIQGVFASQVSNYASRLSIEASLIEHQVAAYAHELRVFIESLPVDISSSNINLDKLFYYQVPQMTKDGCSRLDGTLESEPYSLLHALGLENEENLLSNPTVNLVYILDNLVSKVIEDTGINWLGFYHIRERENGHKSLIKIVYRGSASRAEFPLTSEFAKKSNNSKVGLSGNGIVINDIEAYLWEEQGPYYQCDGKVHSEVCIPVVSMENDSVLGIVDAESFYRDKFQEKELSFLIATAIVLEKYFLTL